jgi:PEP-CTERM motif-containing protein
MRRLFYLLLLVSVVGVSATCVNASTDCERWFATYRRELAHTRSLQRIAAAKHRAKLYAQRKLAGYAPKPKPKLVLAKAPRMTPKRALHHFDLACGVLPEDEGDPPLIATETPLPFLSERPLDNAPDLLPTDFKRTIAENDVPPPPSEVGPPDYPSGGGPPIYHPPYTGGVTPSGGGPGGGNPNTPGNPPPQGNPPPPPATPAVPEPSTYIFMLTGLAGVAGEIRRRIRR